MTKYKEFQGKSLDEAIGEACAYYGVPREKLEIDILNDAKGGIFGLMGMKKACIRAARTQLGEAVLFEEKTAKASDSAPKTERGKESKAPPRQKSEEKSSAPRQAGKGRASGDEASAPEQTQSSAKTAPRAKAPAPEQAESSAKTAPRAKAPAPKSGAAPLSTASKQAAEEKTKPAQRSGRKTGAARQPVRDAAKEAPLPGGQPVPEVEEESGREGLPEFDLENGDLELLRRTVNEVVLRLALPIVGEASCETLVSGKGVRAVLECGEGAGLLVGRDGQTLAAVQYLALRIIARRLGASVPLHIDAGRYRERQDDKLRELALALAEKARQSGRAQSTRPLSAYQRRLVHLALEDDPQVYTRSKGDGAQRRVLILLKRSRPDGAGPMRDSGAESDAGPMRDSGAESDAGLVRDSGAESDAGLVRAYHPERPGQAEAPLEEGAAHTTPPEDPATA